MDLSKMLNIFKETNYVGASIRVCVIRDNTVIHLLSLCMTLLTAFYNTAYSVQNYFSVIFLAEGVHFLPKTSVNFDINCSLMFDTRRKMCYIEQYIY